MGEYDSLILRYLFGIVLVIFKWVYSGLIIGLSAYFSYLPLKLMFNASLVENVIYLGTKSINYVESCSAIGAYIFLGLLILLTRGISFKKGLKMFGWGALFILFANVIRINFLAYLLVMNNINMFVTLHLLTWKLLSGVFVAFIWIILVRKFKVNSIPVYDDFKFLKKELL